MERKGKGEEDAGAARGVNEGGSDVNFYEVGEAGVVELGGLLNQRWTQLKGFFSVKDFNPLILHVVASSGVIITY